MVYSIPHFVRNIIRQYRTQWRDSFTRQILIWIWLHSIRMSRHWYNNSQSSYPYHSISRCVTVCPSIAPSLNLLFLPSTQLLYIPCSTDLSVDEATAIIVFDCSTNQTWLVNTDDIDLTRFGSWSLSADSVELLMLSSELIAFYNTSYDRSRSTATHIDDNSLMSASIQLIDVSRVCDFTPSIIIDRSLDLFILACGDGPTADNIVCIWNITSINSAKSIIHHLSDWFMCYTWQQWRRTLYASCSGGTDIFLSIQNITLTPTNISSLVVTCLVSP